ncbi:MAG TPA: hypothetical protein VFZ49_09725 [Pyrinomonadaceae bacterium]
MAQDNFDSDRRTANAYGLAATLIALLLVGTGCGLIDRFRETSSNSNTSTLSNSGETSNTNNTNDQARSDPETAGNCTVDYYPVDPGLTRRYEITGSGPAKYVLTQKDVSDTGFKEDRTFESGMIVTNNWLCTDDGLRTAEFTNSAVIQSGRFEMETVKSSGLTIPREIEPGMEFDATYDVKVKLRAGPVAVDATGEVKIANKVAAVGESVVVRGETFDTVRIDSTINIVVNMRGRRVEGAKVTTSNWYGKGAGLVKQETGGTFGKQRAELVTLENK